MKVYKLGKFWSVIVYLTTPPIICIFIWLLFRPLTDESITDHLAYYLFITPISLGMSFFGIIALLDVKKNKVILYENRIEYKSTLKNKTLFFDEIKGFKREENYLRIEPKDSSKKRISVSTYFNGISDLEIQLGERIQDLDLANFVETSVEIIENEDFGKNEEEREANLEKAKKSTKIINWTVGIVAIWLVFYPRPYFYVLIISMFLLPIVIIVYKYYKGLIRINEFKNSAYPNIFLGFLLSTMSIFLRSILDFDVLEYKNLWVPSILITAFLLFSLLIGKSEFKAKSKNKILNIVVIFFMLFAYSTGLLKTINCLFDTTNPVYYKTEIIDKRIDSGKHTSYYLEVKPWGTNNNTDDISVSKSEYETYNINDTLEIATKKGMLNIPWFYISN